MNTYTIEFYGRIKGAIGSFSIITADRRTVGPHSAVMALYNEYQDVHLPVVIAVNGVPVRRELMAVVR